MHATYHEATKKLIVTDGPYYVLRAVLPTRAHLGITLRNNGLKKVDKDRWKKHGDTYFAELEYKS